MKQSSFLRVNSIETLSTKDGDGIRFVVFLQGCPLACIYCHNIETWCAKGGELYEVEDLVKQVMRYKSYFGDKGGVTISGGEPMMQDLVPFLTRLKEEGINVAIDTSGVILDKKVIELVDHIILDLKFATEEEYKKYTGGRLKDVLRFLDACDGKRLWVRIVVIPGINDSIEAMDGYLAVLQGKTIERIDLLPFHTLGFDKYQKLGKKNLLENTPAMCMKELAKLQKYIVE